MKKLFFSIIFTAASICAYSNEPIEKLPAIVIDTIYVSSESLVVEYEIFRPFDHVSLTVQSSRNAALSDDKPILLSGNTGKKKTSIPVGLQTDMVTHFNVFLSGGQFLEKGDSVDYQPSAYDFAIFRKQNDRAIKQLRTTYTEEEKVMMDEQIKNSSFVRSTIQLSGADSIVLSDRTKKIEQKKFVDPLSEVFFETRALPMDVEDSTDDTSRSVNYSISITGQVRTVSAGLWSSFIPATDVFLFFRNSSNPYDLYYYIDGSSPCTLFEGKNYSRTDGLGNFSFNFSLNVDLNALGLNQAIIFVARDNEYVALMSSGTTVFHYCSASPVFWDNDNSTIAINHNLPGVEISNKLITVDDVRMASSLGMFWYAGKMLNQLNHWILSRVPVYETNSNDYHGEFNPVLRRINLSNRRQISAYYMFGTPAHEYGHFVNYMLWGANSLFPWGGAPDETVEGFAMFYSYATCHFAYKNGFGFTPPPGMTLSQTLIEGTRNNLDIAPFTNYGTPFTTNYPQYVRWASYLWELFDGHPTFQYTNSDNDDIAYPLRVIQFFANNRGKNMTAFHNAFKSGLSASEQASINGIYNFTVGNQATGMRSQIFSSTSVHVGGGNLLVNFSHHPYGMATHLDTDEISIRNNPTSFRVYRQRFTNCPWELVADIPYVVGQTNYSLVIDPFVSNPMLYNYKLAVRNAAGESAHPIIRTYHNNSGTCPKPSIDGPNNVCYQGSTFRLLDPPAGDIFWTLSMPHNPTLIVNPTGNPTIVTRTGSGTIGGGMTLSARTGSTNGNVIATKLIYPCAPAKISGLTNALLVGESRSFTVTNAPAGYSWSHSPNLSMVSISGNTATFTASETGNAWVSIIFNGTEITKINFGILNQHPFSIYGQNVICFYNQFTTSNGSVADWSVSPGFYVHSSNGTTTHVSPEYFNGQTGTLTATINGVSQSITIQASNINDCWPETVNYYWNDFICNEYFTLNPPLPTEHPNATYRWDIIYSEGVTFGFSSGTYSPTAELWFSDNNSTATVYAHLSIPPYGDSPFAAFEYRMSAVSNCNTSIVGPTAICFSGNYTIKTSHPVSWSVTPSGSSGFNIFSYGNSAYVYTQNHNLSGTITAVANGVTYTLPVYSYSQNNCPWPDTEFIYMTDLACGASVTLTPYPYGTYMWDVLGGENVNLHFQSGTNSNSVNFTFTGDDHGWLRMDAYYNGSPHPTIEYRISADCGRSSPENLIIAYPNPVSGILTIEFDERYVKMARVFQPTARRNQEPTFDVRLYDRLGNMLRHATTKGEAVQFNVYGLPVGMYFVHIYDGTNEKPKIKQIVVER